MPYFEIFWLEFLRTVVIFEISNREFAKHESLTHTMNFGKLKVRVRVRVCFITYALNNGGMKVQIKRAFRSYCLSQKKQ